MAFPVLLIHPLLFQKFLHNLVALRHHFHLVRTVTGAEGLRVVTVVIISAFGKDDLLGQCMRHNGHRQILQHDLLLIEIRQMIFHKPGTPVEPAPCTAQHLRGAPGTPAHRWADQFFQQCPVALFIRLARLQRHAARAALPIDQVFAHIVKHHQVGLLLLCRRIDGFQHFRVHPVIGIDKGEVLARSARHTIVARIP